MPFINNFLKGFQDNLPGMKDYRHANRLFTDDDFKLLPKLHRKRMMIDIEFYLHKNEDIETTL